MKKNNSRLLWLITLISVFTIREGMAVSVKAGKFDLSINGYVDFETTWMSQMPMAMGSSTGPGVMTMDQQFTADQNHLNLIFGVRRDKTRVHLNYESRHSFSTYDGNTGALGRSGNGSDDNVGSFRIAEAYGEYEVNKYLRIRGGNFYTPFGIYNEIRYITPLFATVVLPFIYEVPGNYRDTPLVPSNANFMVSGDFSIKKMDITYNIYGAASKRNDNNSGRPVDRGYGAENTKEKSFGAKTRFSFAEGKYTLGLSGYYTKFPDTYNNSTSTVNHSSFLRGVELDLLLPWDLHLQVEHVTQSNPEGKNAGFGHNKWGYYSRLMYEKGKITPFIMHDVFKDPNEAVYKFQNNRLGLGFGFKVSSNFHLKGEWHWHWFSDQPKGSGMMASTVAPKKTRMLRTSMIFFF